MKKTIFFAGILAAILISCSTPKTEKTEEKTTDEVVENAKMDSIANALEKTTKEIEAETSELDNLINEL
jgi:peptidoglycan hydrolase CwlO-like protein